MTMSDGMLYARVKPYNPKRGYKIQRIHVRCLGRVMEGGNGLSKAIEWVQVRPDQAAVMKTYRQDDQNPDAKEVFDIVDLYQRQAIDRAEEAARMASVGMGPAKLQKPSTPRIIDARKGEDVMPESETASELERRKILAEASGHSSESSAEPTMIAGAEAFISDPAIVGRMAAIDGLPPQAADRLAQLPKDDTRPATAPARKRRVVVGDARPAAGRARRGATEAFADGADVNEALGNEPVTDAEDRE